MFEGGYAIDEFGDSWYGDAAVWTSQDKLNSRVDICYYDKDISTLGTNQRKMAFSESVLSSRHSQSEMSATDDRLRGYQR